MNPLHEPCFTCTKTAIYTPRLLHIQGVGRTFGANQAWYSTSWQRRSGCGPTAASHLLWYLSRTREGAEALCPHDASTRDGIRLLMEEVWKYVTPGVMGVNATSILADGAERFGRERDIPVAARVLNISAVPMCRPDEQAVADFMAESFCGDRPVAFLNLSNGALQNLDNWHWVTLVAIDTDAMTATMYDQGAKSVIDLGLWLRTTTLGGGFVALDVKER